MNDSKPRFAVIRIGEGNESLGQGNSCVTVPAVVGSRREALARAKQLAVLELAELNETAGEEAFFLGQPADDQFDLFEADSKNSNGLWTSFRVAELPATTASGVSEPPTDQPAANQTSR